MIAVPGGKFILASDVVGVDAEREIAELHRRLALAVAEVGKWRTHADSEQLDDDLHGYTGRVHLQLAILEARRATDADPELAKMIGGEQ
jgi:hypothetical protein